MEINIDQLTEAELTDLNHRIVQRLRFLHQARAHVKMLQFKIGERVSFTATSTGRIVTGVITRYNKKSVTIMTDDGQRWNVGPSFLRPSSGNSDANSVTSVIIDEVPRIGP